MKIIKIYALMCFALFYKEGCAQSNKRQLDSLKVIALPDVEVTNSITRLVVSSGKEDNKTTHIVSPGGGYAIRFIAPRSNYHELVQIRLYSKNTSELREGQLRVRIASVAEDGSPADDSLLAPMILNINNLQHVHHHITLQWHNKKFFCA